QASQCHTANSERELPEKVAPTHVELDVVAGAHRFITASSKLRTALARAVAAKCLSEVSASCSSYKCLRTTASRSFGKRLVSRRKVYLIGSSVSDARAPIFSAAS